MENTMPDMEAYGRTLQRVMAEAIARAEQLQAEAVADRETAFADRDKANDLLRDWENKALRAVEDNIPELRAQVQKDVFANLKAKLTNSGKPQTEVDRLLQIITDP